MKATGHMATDHLKRCLVIAEQTGDKALAKALARAIVRRHVKELDLWEVRVRKHTPGPWNVHALSNGHDGVVDGNGCTLASVWNAEDDVQGANALLIAQAPAMLAMVHYVAAQDDEADGMRDAARAILRAVDGEKS